MKSIKAFSRFCDNIFPVARTQQRQGLVIHNTDSHVKGTIEVEGDFLADTAKAKENGVTSAEFEIGRKARNVQDCYPPDFRRFVNLLELRFCYIENWYFNLLFTNYLTICVSAFLSLLDYTEAESQKVRELRFVEKGGKIPAVLDD